jgi:hypothetical protein
LEGGSHSEAYNQNLLIAAGFVGAGGIARLVVVGLAVVVVVRTVVGTGMSWMVLVILHFLPQDIVVTRTVDVVLVARVVTRTVDVVLVARVVDVVVGAGGDVDVEVVGLVELVAVVVEMVVIAVIGVCVLVLVLGKVGVVVVAGTSETLAAQNALRRLGTSSPYCVVVSDRGS